MSEKIPRRGFFQQGVQYGLQAGAGLACLQSVSSLSGNTTEIQAAESPGAPPVAGGGIYMEPARPIPVVRDADVVVCGAGPAGIGAAVSAARAGAQTLLVESQGCLGGIWTAGLLSYLLDYAKPGLLQEILRTLRARDACRFERMCDPEMMKIVLEEICTAAGIDIMLHSRVAAAHVDEKKRLDLIVTESKSGRRAVRGKVFVDATGDGDVAIQAGCGFDYAHPKDKGTQPMSFICIIDGVRAEDVDDCVSWGRKGESWAAPKDRLAKLIREGSGFPPSYSKPSLFPVKDDYFILMANHEYRVDGFNTEDVTRATLQGRAEIHRMIDGLRSLGGPWKNVRICNTPEQIGVRESRRIHGRYTISPEDITEGKHPEDSVCTSSFPVDVHSTDPDKSKGIDNRGRKAKPFGIPFRSLLARDVDGLLLAGRCISGDFFAHSSYRVTGNAVPMGEAAGTAAALAAARDVPPHDIPWTETKKKRDEIQSGA